MKLRRASLAFAAPLVAVAVGAAPRSEAPEGADRQLARGVELVRNGDFDGALAPLNEAVRALESGPHRRSDLAQAYLFLGIAYLELGQAQLAQAKFLDALAADPGLRPGPEQFSRKVIRAFEAARAQASGSSGSKKGRSKTLLLLGLGAAGTGVAVAAGGAGGIGGGRTGTVGVCRSGLDLVAVLISLTACQLDGLDAASTTYEWDFGDGSTGAGETVRHAWATAGTFNVKLTAMDAGGAKATNTQVYTIRTLTGTWDGQSQDTGERFVVQMTQSGAALGGDAEGVAFMGRITEEAEVFLTPSCGAPWVGRANTVNVITGSGSLPCDRTRTYGQTLTRRP